MGEMTYTHEWQGISNTDIKRPNNNYRHCVMPSGENAIEGPTGSRLSGALEVEERRRVGRQLRCGNRDLRCWKT